MATRRPVALVLGAIKGIGRHIGTRFLEDGFRVAFNWFDWEEHLEDLERALSPHGPDVLVRRTDNDVAYGGKVLVLRTLQRAVESVSDAGPVESLELHAVRTAQRQVEGLES